MYLRIMVLLKKIIVSNFKSIIKENQVEAKDNLTAIVGKTGTGKTSFLLAISCFNRKSEFKEMDLPNASKIKLDYTNNMVKRKEIMILKLTFELENEISETLSSIIGKTDHITVSRFFDGHYEIEIGDKTLVEGDQNLIETLKQFKDTITTLQSDIDRAQHRMPQIQNFRPNISTYLEQFLNSDFKNPNEIELAIQSLQNNLNTIPKDPQLLNEINTRINALKASKDVTVQAISNDPVIKVLKELPYFKYLSDPFTLEGSFSVDEFIKDPKKSETFHFISVLGGITPSGIQKVRTQQVQERESYFNSISRELSKKVNEYLNLGYDFKVAIRDNGLLGADLVLMVEDKKTGSTISINEMSEGQKWWVAFYLLMSYLNSLGGRPIVLLLDNPATTLHDEGKGEVLRFLRKMTESGRLQIIYATHERALIDPWRLDRVLFVTKSDEGTIIKSMQQGDHGDLLENIRRHIGSPAKYSLFGAPYAIFFEGISDLNYISAFNELLDRKNENHLEKDVYSINAVNGIDESVHFNTILKAYKTEYVIVLDSNSSKIDEIKKKVGEEDFKDHFLEIKDIIGHDGDIEDLIDEVTYYELFKLAYQNIIKNLPTQNEMTNNCGDKKIVNVYKDYFKNHNPDFDKVLISYQSYKIINGEGTFSVKNLENSLRNFSQLIELIKKKFDSAKDHS